MPVPPDPFRYQREVWLTSLGEHALLVKTPAAAWVELSDGEKLPLLETLARERSALREQLGATHPRLRARLEEVNSTETLAVAVKFFRQTTAEATEAQAVAVEELLERTGIAVKRRSSIAPIIFAAGKASQIAKIARHDWISSIYLDEPAEVELQDASDAAQYTLADTVMWPLGVRGKGQTIGYVEPFPPHTETYHQHTVFASNDVIHAWPGTNCWAQSVCDTLCGTSHFPSGCDCQNGRCVARHATWVSSVMAQVAPEATLAMANVAGVGPNITLSGLDDAFSWFINRTDATIINESWREYSWGVQGVYENALARSHDLLFTVAAGNLNDQLAYRQACPENPNSLCVGAHGFNLQHACYSNWVNPESSLYPAVDREEPDLLAFGGEGSANNTNCLEVPSEPVRLAGTRGTSWYEMKRGTSYAAPAVAASAALLRQYCESNGVTVKNLGLRALLMLGALRNSTDYRYSTSKGITPAGAYDWKDGAGVLSLGRHCEPSDDGIFVETIINTTLGDPSPDPNPDYPLPPFPPQTSQAQNVPLHSSDGRQTKRLWSFQATTSARVRFVVVWNGCDDSPFFSFPDFDLFLYNRTKGHVYFASQSFDDNNEGFDVDLGAHPGNEDGDSYDVILGWLPVNGHLSCPDSYGIEKISWAGFMLEP
jgi:subtilisin family serine protease